MPKAGIVYIVYIVVLSVVWLFSAISGGYYVPWAWLEYDAPGIKGTGEIIDVQITSPFLPRAKHIEFIAQSNSGGFSAFAVFYHIEKEVGGDDDFSQSMKKYNRSTNETRLPERKI